MLVGGERIIGLDDRRLGVARRDLGRFAQARQHAIAARCRLSRSWRRPPPASSMLAGLGKRIGGLECGAASAAFLACHYS